MLRKWIEDDHIKMPEKRQGGTSTEAGTTSAAESTPPPVTSTPSSSIPSSTSTTSTVISSTSTTSTISSASSTSIPPVVSTPSSTPSSSSSTSSLAVSTRPDGGIITITQTLAVPSTSHTSTGGNKGFFDNKAQVGAVFGVAGLVALVLGFFLITTCIRRRRARQFDKDVAEAAAAAAASNANPFFDDEDDRGNQGANWDPRRTSTQYAGQGYGRINEDPYGYAAAGVVGAGAAAGFGRSNTNRYQGGNQRNAYNMNDLSSNGAPPSSYSGYSSGAGYYMNDLPPPPNPGNQDYGRPSFSSSTAPGVAGVGSGGGYIPPDQNLHYRGQRQSMAGTAEDAYGGYAMESDPYGAGNQYSSGASLTHQNSTPYTSGASNRLSAPSPPTTVPASRSPPISPTAPPSYSGHSGEHGEPQPRQQLRPPSFQRPLSGPPPNMPLPPTPGTPDEQGWEPSGRPLRVANE